VSETRNATIRITSDYWLEQILENPTKSFFIQWRNIIMGCCSVYKGAAAYLGLPESGDGFVNANLITRDSRILTTPVILPRPPF